MKSEKFWERRETILRALGFLPMAPNGLFVNKRTKKVFSWQYLEKKPLRHILEKALSDSVGMQFYFLKPPSQALQAHIAAEIRKTKRRGNRLVDPARTRNLTRSVIAKMLDSMDEWKE